MKHLFLFLLAFVTLNVTAQDDWIEHKVDDNLMVYIPNETLNYSDSGSAEAFAVLGEYGIISVTKIAVTTINPDEVVTDTASLYAAYDLFQKGGIKAMDGELIEEKNVEHNDLKLREYSVWYTEDGKRLKRHTLVLYIQNIWYSICYTDLKKDSLEMDAERRKLFTGITPNGDLFFRHQLDYSETETYDPIVDSYESRSEAYQQGQMIARVMVVIFMFLILAGSGIFLIWYLRKNKSQKQPEIYDVPTQRKMRLWQTVDSERSKFTHFTDQDFASALNIPTPRQEKTGFLKDKYIRLLENLRDFINTNPSREALENYIITSVKNIDTSQLLREEFQLLILKYDGFTYHLLDGISVARKYMQENMDNMTFENR